MLMNNNCLSTHVVPVTCDEGPEPIEITGPSFLH